MEEPKALVIGEVLVLLSVFIPTAFILASPANCTSSCALTIGGVYGFFGFTPLTFTPAMCSLYSQTHHGEPRFFAYRWLCRFREVEKCLNSTVGRHWATGDSRLSWYRFAVLLSGILCAGPRATSL